MNVGDTKPSTLLPIKLPRILPFLLLILPVKYLFLSHNIGFTKEIIIIESIRNYDKFKITIKSKICSV